MDPTLDQAVDTAKEHPWLLGLLPHLLTVVGFLLAVFAIARLMSERRQPGHTFAWLLAIVFVPWLSVPLFLIFGGRKLRRLAAQKARLCPVVPGAPPSAAAATFAARVLTLNGACPPVGGNRVEFIASGEDAFHDLERRIREAQHTIHLMTFILSRDAVGKRLVRLLAQRAREGVKVRLLLDSLGCFFSKGSFCDPLRQAGGEVVAFMPMLPLSTRGSANLRNHRKIAVFDHRVASIGGRNLAIEYMGPQPVRRRWRDFGSVIEGPAVGLLNEIFLADWAYASGQPIARLHDELPAGIPSAVGTSELQVVASGPDVPGDPLYEGILSLVQQAERSVWIVTPYFIPDEVLQRSLIVQARAGIDVRVVVPARSNHPVTDLARRHHLRELHRAGVRVLLHGPGMNHAKAILVDESTAVWGSANMDLRSLFVNFEVAVVTYSDDDAGQVGAWMREVFAHSRPMPAPPARPGFGASLAEQVGRLVGPLL
jgi:cardiolipin synthase A/B